MSLEALTLGPFTQSLGWSADQVRCLVKELEQIFRGGCNIYLYNNLYVPRHTNQNSCLGRQDQ